MNVVIVSASGGEKKQFLQILTYEGSRTDEGQIWCARADPWSTRTCQNVFHGELSINRSGQAVGLVTWLPWGAISCQTTTHFNRAVELTVMWRAGAATDTLMRLLFGNK